LLWHCVCCHGFVFGAATLFFVPWCVFRAAALFLLLVPGFVDSFGVRKLISVYSRNGFRNFVSVSGFLSVLK